MKVQHRKSEKSAAVVGILSIMILMVLVGLGAGNPLGAQWKDGGNKYEAVGTVLSREYQVLSPTGPKGQADTYTKVVLRTDDKTTFVIPFRSLDVEAIPTGSAGGFITWSCDHNGNCVPFRAYSTGDTHGILRYHLCQGWMYCFDSFTETPDPNAEERPKSAKSSKEFRETYGSRLQ